MACHSKGVAMLVQEHCPVYRFTTDHAFSQTGTLLVHLEFRSRLEDYVEGNSQKPVAVPPSACHANCAVGKWLHSEGGRKCKDVDLVDSLCRSCEEFYEAASNAVLLMQMGDTELARAAVQDGEAIANASDRFQTNLSKLHQQYSAENPRVLP